MADRPPTADYGTPHEPRGAEIMGTPCLHLYVEIASWRGESGYVLCHDCGATSLVMTSYGWVMPDA